LQTFDSKEDCQNYIGQQSKDHQLVFIVSGRFGREIMSSIHPCLQIISIFVFCVDKEGHTKWAKEFTKVKPQILMIKSIV
jgi:hypothetical protein